MSSTELTDGIAFFFLLLGIGFWVPQEADRRSLAYNKYVIDLQSASKPTLTLPKLEFGF